ASRHVRMIGAELCLENPAAPLETRPGAIDVAQLQEHLAEAVEDRHEVGALGLEAATLDVESLLVEGTRLLELAGLLVQIGQVAERGGEIGMVGRKLLLLERPGRLRRRPGL